MFGTIRKHSKWMWIIIVAATIVSFLMFFGPANRAGGGRTAKYNFGSISGEPITREDYIIARQCAVIEYFFNHRQWPDQDPAAKQGGWNEERAIYERLLLMSKIRELGIQVSPQVKAQMASKIIMDSGARSPQEFQQRVLSSRDRVYASIEDFGRFVEQFIALQQLVGAIGLPGTLVSPAEAATIWKHENQELSADLVFLPSSNYVASVNVTPEALKEFFGAQGERYRVPARVAVNYVEFVVTNYLGLAEQMFASSVTNVAEWAAFVYEQRGGSNAFGGKSVTEATSQLVSDAKRTLARRAATTNAQALHVEITDTEKVSADALDKAAKKGGFQLKASPPFDNQSYNPFLPPAVVQKAFTLNAETPVSEPVGTEDKIFLISLATNLPSYVPAFETVSNRVYADYVQMSASKLANAAGEALQAKLSEGLAKGEKFGTLCTANQVRPLPLSPFSRMSRTLADLPPQVPIGLLQEAAFKVPAGKISNYVPLTSGGFIVFVKEVLPPDNKKLQEEMPRMLAQIRQSSQSDAFQAWFRKQAETGLRNTPLNRPAVPNVRSGGAR